MSRTTRGALTFIVLVAVATSALLAWSLASLDLRDIGTWGPTGLFFLIAYVVAELFPIQLRGRNDNGRYTTSTSFGFVLLFALPLQAAVLAIAIGTLAGDLRSGKPLRVVFNVAQLTLAFAAAGVVLAWLRKGVYVPSTLEFSLYEVGTLLKAGLVMYVVNIGLLCTVIALDQRAPLRAVFKQDFTSFDFLAHLLLLSLAPVFLIVWVHAESLTLLLIGAIAATHKAIATAVAGRHESRHDALTGLPNRRLLDERLTELRATAREPGTYAVLVMDLDGFKIINDTFGHHLGDRLLVILAERLTELMDVDTVSRLGGDEFALIVRGRAASSVRVGALAAQVVELVGSPIDIDGVTVKVGTSVGVAIHRGTEETPEDLMARADSAMYAAKAGGGGVQSSDSAHSEGPGRLSVISDLGDALATGQLHLVYQPQLSLLGDQVVGAEALLRWNHPVHGPISPAAFMPTAEHTELLPVLTRFVIGQALSDAGHRRLLGVRVPISVNVSARDLLDLRLARDVRELLLLHQIPPSDLTLEITESALVADTARAREVLQLLAAMGVRLAVDDFGTGYAPLAMLRDLPITEIKIDRNFVSKMRDSHRGALLVRSMIELAQSLDLRVVAEGIEEPEELQRLRLFGCGVGQGYLLSRPLEADAFRAFLVSHELQTVHDVSTGADASAFLERFGA